MKKLYFILFVVILIFTGCSKKESKDTVTVYSAGDYINPKVIPIFEKESGIKVIYDEYDTNENMYTKISSPNSTYDVVCTSDYIIERLIKENRLSKINKSKITNYKYLDTNIINLTKYFDKNNNYNVPYAYGTLGIIYNKKFIPKEEAKSWNILWNPKYKDEILMPDSVRDIMAVALKKNGFSLNTTNIEDLNIAKKSLIEQKNLVQAYVVDQMKDKLISEEAKIGVIYSGDALFSKTFNDNLDYYVPDEGSNMWIDSWVILKNSENKKNALKFINFMARPDIAKMNYEYLAYSTPNKKAIELSTKSFLKNNPIANPSEKVLDRCEIMKNLDPKTNKIYNKIFMEVKIH